MKYSKLIIPIAFLAFSFTSKAYNDGYIAYEQIKLTGEEKRIVAEYLDKCKEIYDPAEKMLTTTIKAWNAHTDIRSGTVHPVVGSFYYALGLLNSGDEQNAREAFAIIERTLACQNTDPNSGTCGVWPYYGEESLATLKSIVDGNMADFNAVTLLDIYMGHKSRIPETLLKKMENAIILAAKFIQKRNVDLVYTNIAIMGTNVTYMTSHLFNLPEMKIYAKDRLQRVFNFTLENGYAEYNSPDYLIITLDELQRMQLHIVEPDSKMMIDSLYNIGWDMIARHYHKPTAQWAGPHSRYYSETASKLFYGILNQASNGKIDLGYRAERGDKILIKHQMPAYLLSYFLSPTYPHTETDIFEKKELHIVGTTYLTDKYAISSVTKSSMWYQRRPLLAYWGNIEKPRYMRPKLILGFEELSSATIFCEQKDNKIIAGINFATNGAFRHLLADLLNGKLETDDLRLRFYLGNVNAESIVIPKKNDALVSFVVDGLRFGLQLFYASFPGYKGYWEKGGDGQNAWIDYVIYSGPKTVIDLNTMSEAALAFTFELMPAGDKYSYKKPRFSVKDGVLNADWEGLRLNLSVKPAKRSKYLYL